MALDKDFLTGLSVGEEVTEKILKEYEADTTGLKVKRDQLLGENNKHKKELEKLNQDFETEKTGFQKQLEELEGKLKASGSDKLKEYYEAEINKLKEGHAAKLSEAEKFKNDLETQNKTLNERYVGLWRATELDKAMDKIPNLDPAQRGILRDLFWVRHQFDVTKIDDKEELRSKDYKTIQDVLLAYVQTDEGKRFLLANNTGGGAQGGSSRTSTGSNPWAKETLNLTRQMEITRENPTLAKSLMDAAGVKT